MRCLTDTGNSISLTKLVVFKFAGNKCMNEALSLKSALFKLLGHMFVRDVQACSQAVDSGGVPFPCVQSFSKILNLHIAFKAVP